MSGIDGLEKLQRLSLWVRIALVVYIAVTVIAMIGGGFLVYWERTANFTQPEVTFSVLLNFPGNAVLTIATGLFLAWLYRARLNLAHLGVQNLQHSPGWTLGWFFVPLANIVMPFRIMRELFHRSHGEDEYQIYGTVDLVNSWWGCAIAGNLLTIAMSVILAVDMVPGVYLLTPPGVNSGLAVATLALLSGAALYLYRLVGAITRAQQSLVSINQTFA